MNSKHTQGGGIHYDAVLGGESSEVVTPSTPKKDHGSVVVCGSPDAGNITLMAVAAALLSSSNRKHSGASIVKACDMAMLEPKHGITYDQNQVSCLIRAVDTSTPLYSPMKDDDAQCNNHCFPMHGKDPERIFPSKGKKKW